MLRKTAIISFTLVMIMSFTSYGVVADEFGSVPIDINNDYIDTLPDVWGTYIVWSRGLDISGDGVINNDEPSYIMIQDILSEEMWNITSDENGGFRYSNTHYFHASYPSISDGKVLYRFKVGTNYDHTHLGMYNISTNETWNDKIPIPTSLDGGYTYGLSKLNGDWIITTDGTGGQKQGHVYNFETTDYYFLNGDRPTTGVGEYEIEIFDNYICWGERMFDGSNYMVTNIINLDNYKCIQLNASDKPSSSIIKTRLGDIYGDIIVLGLDTTSLYDLYLFDLESVDWDNILGNYHSPEPYMWSDMEGNTTELFIGVNVGNNIDLYSVNIWLDKIYYQNNNEQGKIFMYYIFKNNTKIVYNVPFDVNFGGVHFDKVVWSDDRSGEYNIYRLTTNIESFSTIMMLSIPLIMIGVVVVLFWKALSGGFGGMS